MLSKNLVLSFILSLVMSCGSSDNPIGIVSPSVGGKSESISVGSSSSNGGTNSNIGGNSNTGRSLIYTGGTDANGGDSSKGGSYNGGTADTSQMIGGSSSQDILVTGGTPATGGVGSSIDITGQGGYSLDTATGGNTSVDVATGGSSSIDVITGGSSSIDVTTGGGTSIDTATGGAPSLDLGCQKTILTSINMYVIKDATPNGADTEGNMYVGGDLITSNYSIGKSDIIDCTQYALVVRGDVTGALVYGGKAVSSGTISNSTDQDCGWASRGTALPVDFDLLETQVNNLSTSLSKLATNGTISGSLTLTGKDPTLNVFNITAAQLNTTQVNVNFPAGSSVVVNVSGTTVNWSNGSVCLNGNCSDSSQADYVMWNFYEATSITAGGIAIEGSILAPLATLKGDGGHISGTIIVQYLTGGLEYHPYYFSGCLRVPVVLS
jgi:choice-of-anchor A domain-containing protein